MIQSPKNNHFPDAIVSCDDDLLILVNEDDQEIGNSDKLSCHQGTGTLHRAFSLFIFNDEGHLLLQQRSSQKRLWPLYWSNSCCSHPRQGESMQHAAKRRLLEELSIECELNYLYKFQYQAQYDATGAEHELCSVFVGATQHDVKINANEIAAFRYINLKQLQHELIHMPDQFTPWFKLEWLQLSQNYRPQLEQFCGIKNTGEW